ncbi:alpha/beta fold hydrolase [Nocardioides limicola]|uniref:alpha/beta fold hydrolase n=1 Tax=Nocardioides limicola TaxID=2803368 RepID=UPI00193AE947|nr:alpha/beta hydrolase [Nocardioides sp. DJM-14]
MKRLALGLAAGAVLAGVGATAEIARRNRVIARRVPDGAEFGSVRGQVRTVIADDGVPLHVEVHEAPTGSHNRKADLTLVLVHGYALNSDCWHFQRAGYAGQLRVVAYDHRSHGRSGRSTPGNATIEQLAADLLTVLDQVVPEGPVVLVGHSMGGMTIIGLAEEHPELFGDRIVGVGLIATTAGGLTPHRMLLPMVPTSVGGSFAERLVVGLNRVHRQVDGGRRLGRRVTTVITDLFAFGDDVPASYVAFVDEMLRNTPFEVVAEFYGNFAALDKFGAVPALSSVPTTIICGTADRLTSIGHSRKLHAHIDGSRLVEFPGAGHMVIMERHAEVNDALDGLLAEVLQLGAD